MQAVGLCRNPTPVVGWIIDFFIFPFALQIFTISEFNNNYRSCTIPVITYKYTLQEVGV